VARTHAHARTASADPIPRVRRMETLPRARVRRALAKVAGDHRLIGGRPRARLRTRAFAATASRS
jgi:hypothetical protein